MARYIDADLLIKNIARINDLRRLSTKTVGEAISNTPTADVVEVVRCKDCVHYGEVGDCEVHPYDDRFNVNYFCADGERKDT